MSITTFEKLDALFAESITGRSKASLIDKNHLEEYLADKCEAKAVSMRDLCDTRSVTIGAVRAGGIYQINVVGYVEGWPNCGTMLTCVEFVGSVKLLGTTSVDGAYSSYYLLEGEVSGGDIYPNRTPSTLLLGVGHFTFGGKQFMEFFKE